MWNSCVGEMLGTMTIIIFGGGVVAGCLLKESKSRGCGWIVIITGWFIGVMIGVFVSKAFGGADAHLNPAVTLCFAALSGDFSKLLPYTLAQTSGAFVGATVVWLHYYPHWRVSDDPGAKLAVFCTAPAIRSYFWNFVSEVVGTVILMMGIAAIVVTKDMDPALAPYLIGILVLGIGASLGGTTGYAINPARDFGPRLAHFLLPIAGKGGSDWAYAWVPVLGPATGALLGALIISMAAMRP